MMPQLERFAGVVVAVLLLFTLGDWAVWRVRVAHGGGYGSVTVSRIVVAPLKGNREAYYADGTTVEQCSLSVLPWGGERACWWVERHRAVFER